MRIGILSRSVKLYSTSRLRAAAIDRGHDVEVVDYLRCSMQIAPRRPTVSYGSRELEYDAIIPRVGTTYTFYGTAVIRQFEMMGVLAANTSDAIKRARDKLRSFQLLSREGIGLPVTGFAHNARNVDGLIRSVGGAPVVIKLVEGTQGIGVVLAQTHQAAESVIAAFRQLNADILVQEFIEEARGADYRAFVVDGAVVAAVKRQAVEGEFRSNFHRGGKTQAVKITSEEREMAILAAETLGLKVAGVDIIRAKRGPLIIEVNASPGLEGIETATGHDIAGDIIRFLEKRFSEGQPESRGSG